MSRCIRVAASALGVLLTARCSALSGGLRPGDRFVSTFPDTTTVWRVDVPADARGPVTWTLTLGTAVVDRGERALDDDATASRSIALPVRIPPLREGVAASAILTVRLAGDQAGPLEQTIWILPRHAWAGLRGLLTAAPLRVYDPDGSLLACLRDGGLKPEAIRNPAAVAGLTDGLLVAAEGLSLRQHRVLPEALIRAAAGGARVLLLAPSDGALPLPGHEAFPDAARPDAKMEGADVLRRLDKRLDGYNWTPGGDATAVSFLISAERRQPEAVWSAGGRGWTWLDLDFRAAGGGRLVAVGWAPVGAWESGPAPRHALAAMLRHLAMDEAND